MITAHGHNGQVTFDGNFITITRKGALGRLTVGKGEKRIPVTSVTAVQWKQPGGVVNGFIQFTIAGSNESRSRVGRQTIDAANDENSVIVTKKQAEEFEALRNAVEAAIVARHQPQPVVAAAPQSSKLDQLRQLGELRDAGVLSEDEFLAEKARIMGSVPAEAPTAAVAPPAEAPAPAVAPVAVPPAPVPPAPVTAPPPPAPGSPNWPAPTPVSAAVVGAPVAEDAADNAAGDADATPGSGAERRAKAGRIVGALATGGLSEVGRFALKRRK